MADNVKWIQMKVGMFDGNSFKRIKRAKIGGVPYRDKLTALWFELLDLAGKSNQNGFLVDGNGLPFQCDNYEDIAIMLDRDSDEVKLCIQFYIGEKMVEIIDDMYCLPNFVKYQSLDGLEKIREYKRVNQAKWRAKVKETALLECSSTSSSTDMSTPNLPSISNNLISNYIEIPLITDDEITTLFEPIYKAFPRKGNKQQSLINFTNKVSGLTLDEAKIKSRQIYTQMQARKGGEWADRDPEYIPYCSSWLNAEIPNAKKASGQKFKRIKKEKGEEND